MIEITQKRFFIRRSTTAPGFEVVSHESGAVLRYGLPENIAQQEANFLNAEKEKIIPSWDKPKMIPVTEKKRIIIPGWRS